MPFVKISHDPIDDMQTKIFLWTLMALSTAVLSGYLWEQANINEFSETALGSTIMPAISDFLYFLSYNIIYIVITCAVLIITALIMKQKHLAKLIAGVLAGVVLIEIALIAAGLIWAGVAPIATFLPWIALVDVISISSLLYIKFNRR
jgi:hypothetical protein